MKFSANLGFLWADRSLPEAICAAGKAGFDAVECHWPYDTPPEEVRAALSETGLSMLSLNTRPGNPGEFGLCALPNREVEAREAIDEALAYAAEIETPKIHVMAGIAEGHDAHHCFAENLKYASDKARAQTIEVLIEPINTKDVPGYFLNTTSQALTLIDAMNHPNLKLLFDCYHVQLMEGDVIRLLQLLLPVIGHIQIASVPDRGPPDHGEVDYAGVFELLKRLEYGDPIGAEYKPTGLTGLSLDWLRSYHIVD